MQVYYIFAEHNYHPSHTVETVEQVSYNNDASLVWNPT